MRIQQAAVLLLIVTVLCAGQVWAARGEAGRTGTYYVSTKGDDAADGKSEKTAWRTIAHAAKIAQAGDTVLVAPGDYGDERVVFANSGKKGKPIVVKGHPGSVAVASGGRPTLKNDDRRATAFLVKGKSYIHIEGFDITGYNHPILFTKRARYCRAAEIRSIRPRLDIRIQDDAHHCCVDSCYVSDAGWNSIMIYSDPGPEGQQKRKPCTFNTISNCTVVRSGHCSLDAHTGCPDTYFVGCLIREMGKDFKGRGATGGIYIHNFDIDRMRAIGNAVTECYWGIALIGASDCLMAENLIYGNFRGVTVDLGARWGKPVACAGNVIADNVIFVTPTKDWVAGTTLAGATNNTFARNYIEKKNRDYQCRRYKKIDSTGNAITDPMKGTNSIKVIGGDFSLSYSPGLWPTGTTFRLTGKDNKTIEKTMGPAGVSFGTLAPGDYAVETILPGKTLPAPQYLRAAALPAAEGGAAIVWADCCGDETGFIIERKLTGQKNFEEIAKLKADATRYIDKEVSRKKAIYRVRAVRGEEKSEYSNTDEVVRYGYWFTNRTGLAVDGYTAFGQVERGDLKTLIVEKAKRVERRADAAEGVSAIALLEACTGSKPVPPSWPKASGAKGKAEVWLLVTKPVTATLRWRAGWIRGFVQCEGAYSLELHTAKAVKSVTFNGKAVKSAFDSKTKRVRLDLSGSGALVVELVE